MKNEVYSDLERNKTSNQNPIRYLENVSNFYEDGTEFVTIEKAIKATLLAELNALEWSRKVKPVELEYRINELKTLV